MSRLYLPKQSGRSGEHQDLKKTADEKMLSFPVKYCESCCRCYEGSGYIKDFPTIGLTRRECIECKCVRLAKILARGSAVDFVNECAEKIRIKRGISIEELTQLKTISNFKEDVNERRRKG